MRQAKRPAPKREEDLGNTGVFNVKGGSDYYYADRAHARNLAQLEAQQTAPKYCKSSNHAKVIWVENWCKQKKEMGEPMYRRYQTAEIHCQAQRCRQSYCGTGVR